MLNDDESKEKEEYPLDVIFKKVGYSGKFQKWFLILFNVGLMCIASMSHFNMFLLLAIPDHWCYVPGRENTNYSLEEWKNLTLPIEANSRSQVSYSECKMYNINYTNLNSSFSGEESNVENCKFGWEFDRTYYETIPSENQWVCENEIYISNGYAISKVGEVIGTLVFGQLGDVIGRKPVFFITLIILILGRILLIATANYYILFLIACFIGSLSTAALINSPLIISMETTDEKLTSLIPLLQNISFTFAFCIISVIFWLLFNWFNFAIVTIAPCIIFLLIPKWMIESPKWLASQGKYEKCLEVLETIAKVNGTKVPEDALKILKENNLDKEKSYGFMSLFGSIRLTKHTILLILAAVKDSYIYNIITMNITNLGGNPFINFFFNGLTELPAFFLSRYFCDRYGRRWTQVVPNFLGGIAAFIMVYTVTNDDLIYVTSFLAAFVKFICAFVIYATQLQTLELYPTCVRQSGMCMGFISGSIVGITVPYIVYLGTTYDARYPPLFVALMGILGAVAAAFLPETLHEKCPDTLADAHVFGQNQSFWHLPKKVTNKINDIKLNDLKSRDYNEHEARF